MELIVALALLVAAAVLIAAGIRRIRRGPRRRPATDKQRAFIARLLWERNMTADLAVSVALPGRTGDPGELAIDEAAAVIDWLLDQERVPWREREGDEPSSPGVD